MKPDLGVDYLEEDLHINFYNMGSNALNANGGPEQEGELFSN
jgi:hypothetical protein